MKKTLPFFLFCMLLLSSNVFAQDRSVSGTVTSSDDGAPLPGVNVTIRDTAVGTVTDADGKYKLNLPADATQLVFSFVGYVNETIDVGNKSVIDIRLVQDISQLQEIVVTAFGVEKEKKALGYAVSEISGREIQESTELNMINALQGKIPGVTISQNAGGASGNSRIVIRGNASLSGNNQPLIIIDNVPIDNTTGGAGEWGGQDYGNELNNLNPDDYESVSVLKGPAAAALYGSRAANGAIVIKTKKGKTRKGIGVSYNSSFLSESIMYTPDFQNVFGAGYMSLDLGEDGNGAPFLINPTTGNPVVRDYSSSYGPKMEGQMIEYIDGVLRPHDPQPDNLRDFYQNGFNLVNNIALDGANDQTSFRVSFGHNLKEGVVPNNEFERGSANLRVTHQLSDRLNINLGANYNITETRNPPALSNNGDNIARQFIYAAPRNFKYDVSREFYKNPDGSRNRDIRNTNAFWRLYERNIFRDDRNLRADVTLNYAFTDWLNLTLMGNTYTIDRQEEGENAGENAGGTGGSYTVSNYKKKQSTIKFLLNLDKEINQDFHVSASVGGEQWRTDATILRAETQGGLIVPNNFSLNNSINPLKTSGGKAGGSGNGEKQINSFYAFADLSYKNFLFLNLTGRNDWSSSLTSTDGSGDNSVFYPSASLGFAFTDALSLDSRVLDFGKIRASWARVGGDTDPYRLLADFRNRGNFGETGPLMFSWNNGTVPPNDLKPEITTGIEFGTELYFLSKRLTLDFTYYDQKTTNQILAVGVSSTSGANSRLINVGEIQNKGFELLVGVTPVRTRNFSWNVSFNMAKNNNEVVELAEGIDRLILGRQWDVWSVAQPGEPYGNLIAQGFLKNENGDRILNADGFYQRDPERTVVGNQEPDWTGGISNTVSFKGLTLSATVDIRKGGEVFSGSHFYGHQRGIWKSTLQGRNAEYGGVQWTDGDGNVRNDGFIPDGVTETGERWTQPIPAHQYWATYGSWGSGVREVGIVGSGFVKLRELILNYRFPTTLLEKTPFQTASIALVGRNLWYIQTDMPNKINPEGTFNSGNGGAHEYGSLPPTRSVGFTLNVSF